MPNAALFRCTLPAERARGAVFAQDFRDRLFLARDGWTLYNSPSFRMPRKGGGVVLNGTNQCLTRPLNGELNNDELTIEFEFWPDFAADAGADYYFMDVMGGTGRYIIRFVSANAIQVYAGNTTLVLNILYADFNAEWVQGGRNLLTLSLSSGDNKAWLNGISIKTSATAWTPLSPETLYLASRNNGTTCFDGIFGRYTIGHYLATEQEHSDAWNQTTWNWPNKLAYDFSFSAGRYDPVNKRTLDTRTDSLYATLGDGAGTGEPTQGKGYMTFDGVDDYLSGIANPTGNFTVMGLKDEGTGWEFFADNDLTNWTPIFTSGNFAGALAALMVAPSVLTQIQENDALRKLFASVGSEV